MSKHTPGPWLLEDRTVYALNSDSSPVNRFWCQVERGWADQRERTSFEEAEANARLIAAAPELFEALAERMEDAEQGAFEEWLLRSAPSGDVESVQRQWLESYAFSDFADTWKDARAALAKATGEQA